MSEFSTVEEHYSIEGLPGRFDAALESAGLGTGQIEWSKLAPIDQFHACGLEATREMAEALGLTADDRVLDVGSGFGGPARFLAATFRCRVTGIDLAPSYIEVTRTLAQRTGLTDLLTFVQGNALELPFPDESFDHAWTQHVAMNVQDKNKLYAGIYRVLKPGGKLAIYDVVRGDGEPVIYPPPWAREAAISFLATPGEMMKSLLTAGFREVSSDDKTQEGLAWFAAMPASAPPGGAPAFNLGAVLGADMRQMVGNFAHNLQEGRVRLTQVIVQKD